MSRKINLYYFGDTGIYDKYSPVYVCSKKFVSEILYLIAYNPPFSISKNEIIEELKLREEEFSYIIKSLEFIKAVDVKNDRYKLNFTVFLEKDIPVLKDSFLEIGKEIGDIIINNSKGIYDKLPNIKSYGKFSNRRGCCIISYAIRYLTEKHLTIFLKKIYSPLIKNRLGTGVT